MRKSIFFLYVLLLTPIVFAAEQDNTKLRRYVDTVVNEGFVLLDDPKLSSEEKVSRARKLMTENLYLEWMAQYTLGKYKRTLSKAQIANFVKIYSDYVIKTYSDMIKNYNGQKAIIKQINQIDDKEFIVKMEIKQPDGKPSIMVDYLVVNKGNLEQDNDFKVGDIITEGVSMINSQQDEFGNAISNKGFDALLSELQAKSH